MVRALALGILVSGGIAAGFAQTQDDKLLPPDAQIKHAVRTVWLNAANRRPLCASTGLVSADQQGSQELQQAFADRRPDQQMAPSTDCPAQYTGCLRLPTPSTLR